MWRVPCHSWEEEEVEHVQHPGWASGKTYTLSHETVFFVFLPSLPHHKQTQGESGVLVEEVDREWRKGQLALLI